MEKIKYIENNPNNGISYDWKKVKKVYKSLGVPKEYDYSEILPLENDSIKWHVLLSERSVGKTTNILLIGMVLNAMYGTVIQLVRHNAKEQKASYFQRLFESIVNYNRGQYIQKLTNGVYNTVVYYHRAFYYGYTNDAGKIERAENPFCIALSSADCYTLCSTYECPTGDFIVLDECFNETNTPDEFIHFVHLHKTIVRERLSDKIFILGNNLDVNNIWFRQLTIHDQIRKMKRGEMKTLYTCENMPIFCGFLTNTLPQKRVKFNFLHYGFGNSELNSITGSGEWKMKQYPQACKVGKLESIQRGIYFSYHDEIYLESELVRDEFNRYYILVHPCNIESALKSEILYVMRTPERENELFFGKDNFIALLVKFISKKRILFSDNETGNIFEKFYNETGGKLQL